MIDIRYISFDIYERQEDMKMNRFVGCISSFTKKKYSNGSKRKAMNRNWYNQKANPALNTKAGNK